MNSDLKIFCVTNKPIPLLEKTNLIMAGVGTNEFSSKYIKSLDKENIFHKKNIILNSHFTTGIGKTY